MHSSHYAPLRLHVGRWSRGKFEPPAPPRVLTLNRGGATGGQTEESTNRMEFEGSRPALQGRTKGAGARTARSPGPCRARPATSVEVFGDGPALVTRHARRR